MAPVRRDTARRVLLRRAPIALALLCALGACGGYGDRGRMSSYAPAPRASGASHVVRSGDTVYSIARRYGVRKEAIRDVNGLDGSYAISVGQRLRLPSGARAGRAVARAPARSERQTRRVVARPARTEAQAKPRRQTAATFGKVEPMLRPVDGEVISRFGAISNGAPNDGIDIAATVGAPVRAAADGQVAFVSDSTSPLGSVVLVQHDGGIVTIYGRIQRVVAHQGQRIARGAPLAHVAAPRSGGRPALHFEMRRGSEPIDPTPYL